MSVDTSPSIAKKTHCLVPEENMVGTICPSTCPNLPDCKERDANLRARGLNPRFIFVGDEAAASPRRRNCQKAQERRTS